MIAFYDSKLVAIKLGTLDISKVCLGSTEIWPNSEIDAHSISIEGPTNIIGETSNLSVLYDNTIPITTGVGWTIFSGNEYATIDATGLITINSIADDNEVVIRASYGDLSAFKTVRVTYRVGSTTETEVETVTDEDGNTTTTVISVVTNEDGSSEQNSTSTTYDFSGNITGTSENTTINNVDGSSTSTTTNYDASGNPIDTVNESTDTSGNVDTQNIEYDENGDPTVTGYTIDTSANPDGEKDITGDGVNTGFYPFDGGDGFELHIRFRSVKTEQPNPPIVVDTEDTSSYYHFTILASKDPNVPYSGFHIRWTLIKNNYRTGNIVFGYRGKTGSATNRNLAISTHNDEYDYTIAYDPKLKKYPSKFRCQDNLNGSATITLNIDFNPLDIGFTLGYNINQQGKPYRYSNVQIYEFSITKL
jgi:hypothetical protein